MSKKWYEYEQQIPPDSRFGHEGELAMRARYPSPIYQWDEYTLSGMIQKAIAPSMARFIEAQPFFFIGTSDDQGKCDAAFRSAGIHHETGETLPTCLVVENGRMLVFPDYGGDTLDNSLQNIAVNPHIGMIFIDFIRVGRIRVNGLAHLFEANEETKTIWPEAKAYVRVIVEQAYGNCPARIPRLRPVNLMEIEPSDPRYTLYGHGELSPAGRVQETISPEIAAFIEAQPFFFISTADAQGHCDVSFRGTEPDNRTGEILPSCRVIDDGNALVFPDYSGNALYNSLGNILQNPHMGMVFIDFTRIAGARVSGKVSLEEINEDIKRIWPRAQAYLRVAVTRVDGHCPERIPRLVPM